MILKFSVKVASKKRSCKEYKVWDCYGSGYNLTICYDSFGLANGVQDSAFSYYVENGSADVFYSVDCRAVNHIFGGVGLQHGSYCILNKKYSKDDYNRIVLCIINDMKARGEWGEFFPLSHSTFGYNESPAYDHYPLTSCCP